MSTSPRTLMCAVSVSQFIKDSCVYFTIEGHISICSFLMAIRRIRSRAGAQLQTRYEEYQFMNRKMDSCFMSKTKNSLLKYLTLPKKIMNDKIIDSVAFTSHLDVHSFFSRLRNIYGEWMGMTAFYFSRRYVNSALREAFGPDYPSVAVSVFVLVDAHF